MKLHWMMLFGLLPLVLVPPSNAMTRIAEDMGGPLGDYLLMFAAIRDSGEQVMIDGRCFSACTLITAMVPKDKICITERAVLGSPLAGLKTARESALPAQSERGYSTKCIRQ